MHLHFNCSRHITVTTSPVYLCTPVHTAYIAHIYSFFFFLRLFTCICVYLASACVLLEHTHFPLGLNKVLSCLVLSCLFCQCGLNN